MALLNKSHNGRMDVSASPLTFIQQSLENFFTTRVQIRKSMIRPITLPALATLFALLLLIAPQSNAQKLELSKGQSICILGNTLAERMQHDGFLEAMIQYRNQGKEITIRNMGFSADEIDIRLRSSNFGSPESWLTKHKADVIFAMFGYNDSFAGEAGIEEFKTKLADWVAGTKKQKFNGKSAPTIVLFSPLAHET